MGGGGGGKICLILYVLFFICFEALKVAGDLPKHLRPQPVVPPTVGKTSSLQFPFSYIYNNINKYFTRISMHIVYMS